MFAEKDCHAECGQYAFEGLLLFLRLTGEAIVSAPMLSIAKEADDFVQSDPANLYLPAQASSSVDR